MADQVLTWELVIGATHYPCSSVEIIKDLNKHNYARAIINSTVLSNQNASIECNGAVAFENCYIEKATAMGDERCDIDLIEWSNKLYSEYCYSPAVKGIFKPNIIIRSYDRNTGVKTTISDYISNIATKYNHSGITITVHDVDGVGTMTEVPELGIPLPDMTISHMTIGNALKTFIVDTLNLVLWYEYSSATQFDLYYGLIRDEITLNYTTSNEYIISTRLKDDATKTPVNGIVIKNEDGTVHGTAGTPTTGPTQMYTYSGSFSENDLNALAAKYLAQYGTSRLTYSVVFEPGTLRFKEGDVFDGLGDQTITPPMAWKDVSTTGNPWQIQNVRITMNSTTVEVANTA